MVGEPQPEHSFGSVATIVPAKASSAPGIDRLAHGELVPVVPAETLYPPPEYSCMLAASLTIAVTLW